MPRVERGERVNVGLALFCRQLDFLELRTLRRRGAARGDRARARLPRRCERRLAAIEGIARGEAAAGPMARLSQSERFGWIVAPASTIIQPSRVHTGLTKDPAATLDRLFALLVA